MFMVLTFFKLLILFAQMPGSAARFLIFSYNVFYFNFSSSFGILFFAFMADLIRKMMYIWRDKYENISLPEMLA